MNTSGINQREKNRPNGQQLITLSLAQWRWVVLRSFLQIEQGHIIQAIAKGTLRHDLLGSLAVDNTELISILREIDDEIERALIPSLRQGENNDD